MKKKLYIISIVFIAFIICFTILSRIAHSMSGASVETVNLTSMTLNNSITAEGEVTQKNLVAVKCEEEQMVKSICVNIGESVKAGEELYSIDLDELDRKIQQKQNEIDAIELSIDKEESNIKAETEKKNHEIERANEDYDLAVNNYDKNVNQMYEKYVKAVNAYNEYLNYPDAEKSGEELENAVIDAESGYNSAVEEREKAVIEAKRAVEDANLIIVEESGKKGFILEKEKLEREMGELQNLKNNEEKIISPIAGTIAEIKIKAGEVMNKGAAIFIADESLSKQVKIQVPEGMKSYVSIGTKAEITAITMSGETKTFDDLTVVEMRTDAENEDGNIDVIIDLKSDEIPFGTRVSVTCENKTAQHNACIPLTAVRMNQENRFFVYTVEEQESTLGIEYIAKQVDVNILDQDGTHAAISSAGLNNMSKIINTSTKQIQNGSRVKVVD